MICNFILFCKNIIISILRKIDRPRKERLQFFPMVTAAPLSRRRPRRGPREKKKKQEWGLHISPIRVHGTAFGSGISRHSHTPTAKPTTFLSCFTAHNRILAQVTYLIGLKKLFLLFFFFFLVGI